MGDEAKPPGDCVKVAIRMRPLSSKELGNNESSIVELEEQTSGEGNGKVTITDPEGKEKPAEFAFDIVFGTKVEQSLVYDCVGKSALNAMFEGYNGTIFAYGQTGSGKSWSMLGGAGELRGIIPRVNETLFDCAAERVAAIPTRKFLVMCSFFEIYNEIIFDLLNPSQDRSKLGAGLQVKEHPVLGIYVKDLQEMVVSDADKLTSLMDSGTKNRAVSSTLMNSVSSRSHSIFTIKVHQKDDEDKSRNVFAKLNLVDLAGSERQKGTGASGQTLKEGANINKSLSALGNVINALVENANGKKVFVPFRNSKLTRVLQESLGGNSLCTMLAALSPAACNFEETLSTLRYANRAKAIKVSATKNEEASQISRLNAEIEELKKKLAAGDGGGGGGGGGLMAEEERKEMQAKFHQQLADMQQMVSSSWEDKAQTSAAHEQQMAKIMEEHKRQQKAMLEERRKRYKLLQDQADLELTIRGLMDTVQGLPPEPTAAAAGAAEGGAEGADPAAAAVTNGASPHPCSMLRSGEVLKGWLKTVAALVTLTDELKQQSTMSMLFHSAFTEDLRLWVEGEETNDGGMARTGCRRALTKLDTLRRECAKLSGKEEESRQKLSDFTQQVVQATREWEEEGKAAILAQLKAAESEAPDDKKAASKEEAGTMSLQEMAVEDVGKILRLIGQQAESRFSEFSSLASLEVGTTAALVVRGTSLIPGGAAVGPDADLLRNLAAGAEGDETGSAAPAGAAAGGAADAAARGPREDRPLQDWVPEDCDESVEGTAATLAKVVQLDGLNKKKTPQELLARPPPKFVHDVALLVGQATGFPQNVSEDWPESREGKLDLLQQVADAVSKQLNTRVDFDPGDVLKGKEVPKTLRLLQLLAVAAAKSSGGGGTNGAAKGGGQFTGQQNKALTKASDMAQALETMSTCLQRAADMQVARRDGGDGHSSPSRELESNFRNLQERLQEEIESKTKIEQDVVELKRQVEDSRAVYNEKIAQLEEVRNAASNVDNRKQEMQQQIERCRAELIQRAGQFSDNADVVNKRAEFTDITSKCGNTSVAKSQLTASVKKLQQEQVEMQTSTEKMEMEVKRIKLRLAGGLDGPPLSQNEDVLVLQAEKQKWDVRVSALEEKLLAIGEADDKERQRETGLMDMKKEKGAKRDEAQAQLQVAIEERDGLREGMDLLWQEKSRADEELENLQSGYTGLSDRLVEKQDEHRELEEQLQQYESILAMLQENFEKSRNSPPTATNGAAPAPAPPAPKGAADDDGGSSHYSQDGFEDLDED